MLNLTYLQPLDVIDQSRPAHLDWLRQQVDDGIILLAGRLPDQSGAVLITADIEADEAQRIIDSDPYQQAGVVAYEVRGFNGAFRAPGL